MLQKSLNSYKRDAVTRRPNTKTHKNLEEKKNIHIDQALLCLSNVLTRVLRWYFESLRLERLRSPASRRLSEGQSSLVPKMGLNPKICFNFLPSHRNFDLKRCRCKWSIRERFWKRRPFRQNVHGGNGSVAACERLIIAREFYLSPRNGRIISHFDSRRAISLEHRDEHPLHALPHTHAQTITQLYVKRDTNTHTNANIHTNELKITNIELEFLQTLVTATSGAA